MTTTRTTTPARAARRQLFRDRVTEYLVEHNAKPENAEGYARDILAIADDLGFALPAALDDPPPAPARCLDGPGRREFAAARAALAARRSAT